MKLMEASTFNAHSMVDTIVELFHDMSLEATLKDIGSSLRWLKPARQLDEAQLKECVDYAVRLNNRYGSDFFESFHHGTTPDFNVSNIDFGRDDDVKDFASYTSIKAELIDISKKWQLVQVQLDIVSGFLGLMMVITQHVQDDDDDDDELHRTLTEKVWKKLGATLM